MMVRASVSTSWRPRAVVPSRVHTASANRSPSPATSASSLQNAYEAIRLAMARSLETETWFVVVMIRPYLSGVSQCFTQLGAHLADAEQAAAGGVEDLSVDPAGVVGCQEGDDVADVFGLAHPALNALGGGPGLGRRVGEPVIHLGVGEPRRQSVDTDVAVAQIPGQGAGQGADRALGHGVHGGHRAGHVGTGRGQVDDPGAITQPVQAVLDGEQQ